MQSEKIERLFVDFILNEIGPNEIVEKNRNEKYLFIKQIIENTLLLNYNEYIPHLFIYGSFSLKTYLKDSDIDITIILENKENHELLINPSNVLINNILQIIKNSFEDYNEKMQFNTFSEIKIILADIKLLKCQIDSYFINISINNFSGLLKIFFMDYIFKAINKDNKDKNKSQILLRSILLIKAWCYYEGNLLGSNIGLMASCALELITLNIFNTNYTNIKNEIDVFFYFFNFVNNIDFDKSIITLFGPISKNDFFNNINDNKKKELFWYINNDKKENYLFNLEELKEFMDKLNKSVEILFPNEDKNSFQNKYFNIIDPLNENNNLGKSINYHSFSKMKNTFQYMVKELNKINKIKQLDDPFLYINSLLKLFNTSLSMNFIELFINYLNMPKIHIYSQNKEHYGYNLLKVDKNEILKFNNLFNFEQNDKKEEEKKEENNSEEEEEEEDEDDNEVDLNKIKNIKNVNIKYQKFDIIINYKLLNKLFQINNNYNEQMAFYDKLRKISEQNYNEINDFMKNFKII